MIRRFVVFTVCVLMALPCSVMGMLDVPQVELAWTGNGDGGGVWNSNYSPNDVTTNGDCEYYLDDAREEVNNFMANWHLTYSPDPYVIAAVGVTNKSSVTQTFTLVVTTPVSPPITTNTLYGGSMSGSFTTGPGGGTLSTASPDPLYYGLIDSVGLLSLYPDPSSWTTTTGGTISILAVSAGLPPSLPNGPISTDISIQFKFTLTPGDAAAFTGYFEVTPEPATICLLGLGALGLLRKRRA